MLETGGCSSAGRAAALQAVGRRFDPDQLHQRRVEDPAARKILEGCVASGVTSGTCVVCAVLLTPDSLRVVFFNKVEEVQYVPSRCVLQVV